MTKENKEWIDNSSYESLLSKWRYAPVGCELFQGDTGEYYSKVMKEKKMLFLMKIKYKQVKI